MVEKSLDMHSRGAIGAADVERFYDSLDMLKIAHYVCRNGGDYALARAVLVVHLGKKRSHMVLVLQNLDQKLVGARGTRRRPAISPCITPLVKTQNPNKESPPTPWDHPGPGEPRELRVPNAGNGFS